MKKLFLLLMVMGILFSFNLSADGYQDDYYQDYDEYYDDYDDDYYDNYQRDYRYDDDSTETHDGTTVIEPASGTGRWILANIHTISLTGEGSEHYFNVGSATAPSNPSEGDCYYNTTTEQLCCYDAGDAAWECVQLQ